MHNIVTISVLSKILFCMERQRLIISISGMVLVRIYIKVVRISRVLEVLFGIWNCKKEFVSLIREFIYHN